MKIFENYKRKRAIKKYIGRLPFLLARDYGRSNTYTPKQVKSTIERSGLNTTFAFYGIVMFSSSEELMAYQNEVDEVYDIDTLRSEIADQHFGGNSSFNVTDIESVSSSYGSSFDDGGFGSGGGDGGGGGD